MRLPIVAAIIVASAFAVGCQSDQTSGSKARARATTQAASVEQRLSAIEPGTEVGVVSAVLPKKGLLAVSDVEMDKVFVGDTLVLVTPNRARIIGAGHVVEKTANAVHVSYDVNESARAPRVGDLAVRPVSK